jgi:hypothetical protein
MTDYKRIICIHPNDTTTSLLAPIGELFESYIKIIPNDEAHANALTELSTCEDRSLIIFLGHGTGTVLYGAETEDYKRKEFISITHAENLFKFHDILLISCYSATFLDRPIEYNSAIGFGNIISSIQERNTEAELVTGHYRPISPEDIEIFNNKLVDCIKRSIQRLIAEKISFADLYNYFTYFFNQEISNILLNKSVDNRKEIAKLMFELRDEMRCFSR